MLNIYVVYIIIKITCQIFNKKILNIQFYIKKLCVYNHNYTFSQLNGG